MRFRPAHFATISSSTPCSLAAVAVLALTAAAQGPEPSQPTPEHQWLQKFVGQWTAVGQPATGDGEPAMQCKGVVKVRSIGGLWIVSEIKMNAMGQMTEAMQTIGYNPDKKQYVGTWIDGMLNHLWHYTGTREAGGEKLVMLSEGPDVMDPTKTAKYRDTYEFLSDDKIATTSDMQGADGKWVPFMTGTMTRSKAAK